MHWLTQWDLNATTLQPTLVDEGQMDQILMIKLHVKEAKTLTMS